MWIFSKFGFFSVVTGRTPAEVVVRARVLADLQALSDLAAIDFAIVETPDRDYPFRAFVPRDLWAGVLARIGDEQLDYPNFKEAVGKRDHDRAVLYSRVWGIMASGLAGARPLSWSTSEHWVVKLWPQCDGGPWLVQATAERSGAKVPANAPNAFRAKGAARRRARELIGLCTQRVGVWPRDHDSAELREVNLLGIETAWGRAQRRAKA